MYFKAGEKVGDGDVIVELEEEEIEEQQQK